VTSFGNRYLVEITGAMDYDLLGRVIKPLKSPSLAKLKSQFTIIN
jgi:hypothetical protein